MADYMNYSRLLGGPSNKLKDKARQLESMRKQLMKDNNLAGAHRYDVVEEPVKKPYDYDRKMAAQKARGPRSDNPIPMRRWSPGMTKTIETRIARPKGNIRSLLRKYEDNPMGGYRDRNLGLPK